MIDRLDKTKEKISKLEDRSVKNMQNETWRAKWMKNTGKSVSHMRRTEKSKSSKREVKDDEAEEIFKEILAKFFIC